MTTQGESKISGRILDMLKGHGIFAFKVHGSALMMAGLPDIIACVEGKFVGLETKVPEKRNNVSPIQKRVHEVIEQSGGTVRVICGPGEALAVVSAASSTMIDADRARLIQRIRDLAATVGRDNDTPSAGIQAFQEGQRGAFDLVIQLMEGKI